MKISRRNVIYTHFGVSGPIILSGSAYLLIYKNIEELLKQNKIKLSIDLKPGLTFEQLDLRILRDFESLKNKQFKNSLEKLLPQKNLSCIIERTKIDQNKKVNEITKEERKILVNILKSFEIYIKNPRPIEEAIITKGGIDIKQINPKNLESKIISGLFFCRRNNRCRWIYTEGSIANCIFYRLYRRNVRGLYG
jgi:predicted flavoprotein YhiN